MHFWLVVVLGLLGAIVGQHLHTSRHGVRGVGRATAYGAVAGVLVGVILPMIFGLVGLLFQLFFTLGVIALLVLAAVLVWRLVRH